MPEVYEFVGSDDELAEMEAEIAAEQVRVLTT